MSNIPVDTDENDFVLKHRIAGAAFLLFFGALVLPWLLGAPTDAKKVEPVNITQGAGSVEEYVPEDLENEVLAQLKDEVSVDEKVYISKVTPAGFTKVSETSTNQSKKVQVEKLAQEKAKKQLQEQANQLAADQNKTEKDNADKIESAKLAALEKETDEAEKKENIQSVVNVKKDDDDLKTALTTTQAKNIIKSGWVVQVGVFTDKSGADKISKALTEKGFKTSSTIVDTNKGPGTGTRVWMGPYSDRAKATKAKTNLAEKTGTSGFIRAYP